MNNLYHLFLSVISLDLIHNFYHFYVHKYNNPKWAHLDHNQTYSTHSSHQMNGHNQIIMSAIYAHPMDLTLLINIK